MDSACEFLTKGTILESRYVVDRVLGTGGSGWVLKAEDQLFHNQLVALKILYPHLLGTENAFKRFQNEVSISRRLSHPNIVQTFGFGRTKDSLAYVAMEYIEGKALSDALQEHSFGLPMDRVENILAQILEGLLCAHSQGIIHRDLKPHNVLLTLDETAKIADFGLAQMLRQESQLTKTGNVAGSAQYMSPEQILGQHLNQQTDIYSLGILAYQMAAGKLPFQGETVFELANQHLHETLPTIEGRPKWFLNFLNRATAKKLSERFKSIEEIRDNLIEHLSFNAAKHQERSPQRILSSPSHDYRIVSWARKHRRRVLLISTILIISIPSLVYPHYNSSYRHRIARLIFRLEKHSSLNLQFLLAPFGVHFSFHDKEAPFSNNKNKNHLVRAYFYAGMDPNYRDPRTKDCLLHRILEKGARNDGQLNTIADLIAAKPDLNLLDGRGMSPLSNAIRRSDLTLLKILLKAGADPNVRNSNRSSPLGFATRRGNRKYVQLLLDYNADPNLRLGLGGTVLHSTARDNQVELMKLLLSYNADPNLGNVGGYTPLFFTIGRNTYSANHRETIDILTKISDLSHVSRKGDTALSLAKERGDSYAIEVIEKRLADKNASSQVPG